LKGKKSDDLFQVLDLVLKNTLNTTHRMRDFGKSLKVIPWPGFDQVIDNEEEVDEEKTRKEKRRTNFKKESNLDSILSICFPHLSIKKYPHQHPSTVP